MKTTMILIIKMTFYLQDVMETAVPVVIHV